MVLKLEVMKDELREIYPQWASCEIVEIVVILIGGCNYGERSARAGRL